MDTNIHDITAVATTMKIEKHLVVHSCTLYYTFRADDRNEETLSIDSHVELTASDCARQHGNKEPTSNPAMR